MSGDVTDKLPPDGPRGTNPMLERILEEVLANRAALARLETRLDAVDAKLDALGRDMRVELEDMDRSIAGIQREDARRWSRLDERVQRLEHPEEAKP
jgi:hypothetical protein